MVLILMTVCWQGLQYADCIPCRGTKPNQKNGWPGYDTGSLWPRGVVSVRVTSIGQIEVWKLFVFLNV